MGWALTYAIKLKRPLNADEQAALNRWSDENELRLSSARGDAFDAWRGLLPDERIAELKQSQGKRSLPPGTDYAGFFQVRTEAHFKKLVRKFQALETLLPVIEILLSDDYYLADQRPSAVDLSSPLSPRMDEPAAPAKQRAPVPSDEAEPDPLSKEVDRALEKAKRDFELWKKSKK